MAPAPSVSYLVPLRASAPVTALDGYLAELGGLAEVIVVDGSSPSVYDEHHRRWATLVTHVPVDSELATAMGKVGGVLTGLKHATSDIVVIADDDVRWDEALLARAVEAMDGVDVLRPQNRFVADDGTLPWHARWDTGRILINRVTGGDWPGTLVVRKAVLERTGGYDGSVMFENLELIRTVCAAGGRHRCALDLVVPRRPPTTRQFLGQRVRQAFDELARPGRLAVWLAVLPAAALGGRRMTAAMAFTAVAVAEVGRRRAGGPAAFDRPTAALWAPAWVAERAVTSWLAVASRVGHGGIPYRGTVLRRAATPTRVLRRRLSGQTKHQEPSCRS